jgi:hypothetical protein
MKHLRRFDESLKDELQDFCDTNLAYLIDEGFKVRISKFEGDNYHQIMIGTPESSNSLWSQMKDQVLPFLHFLLKDYELYYDNGSEPAMGIIYHGKNLYGETWNKQEELKLNQLDDLPDNKEIATLFIRVVRKEDKEVKKAWFRNF